MFYFYSPASPPPTASLHPQHSSRINFCSQQSRTRTTSFTRDPKVDPAHVLLQQSTVQLYAHRILYSTKHIGFTVTFGLSRYKLPDPCKQNNLMPTFELGLALYYSLHVTRNTRLASAVNHHRVTSLHSLYTIGYPALHAGAYAGLSCA